MKDFQLSSSSSDTNNSRPRAKSKNRMAYNGPHINQLSRRQRKGLRQMMKIDERQDHDYADRPQCHRSSSESSSSADNDASMHDENEIMDNLINDVYEHPDVEGSHVEEAFVSAEENMLREEMNTPLYPGAKTSRLATSLLLLNLQAKYKWSNTSVTSLFG